MSSRPKDYRRPVSLGLSLPEIPDQQTSEVDSQRSDEYRLEAHYDSVADIFGQNGGKSEVEAEEYHSESSSSLLGLSLVLVVAATALALMVLITLGKIGPQCTCSEGPALGQQSKPAPDESFLLQLIDELSRNHSLAKNKTSETVQLAELADADIGNETSKLNAELLNLKQEDRQFGQLLLTLNTTISSGITNLTRKVYTSLERLRNRDKSLNTSFLSLNSTTTDDLKQKIEDYATNALSLAIDLGKVNSTLQDIDTQLNSTLTSVNKEISANWAALTKLVQDKANQMYQYLHSVNATQKSRDSVISGSFGNVVNELEAFNKSLGLQMENLKQSLQAKDEDIQRALQSMNTTLNDKVFQISQMEGPQGPQGSSGPKGPKGSQGAKGQDGPGDLSLCTFHFQKSTGNTPTDVLLQNSHSTLAGKKLVGLVCSSNADRVTYRLKKESSFWKCDCLRDPNTSIECYIQYWVCPSS